MSIYCGSDREPDPHAPCYKHRTALRICGHCREISGMMLELERLRADREGLLRIERIAGYALARIKDFGEGDSAMVAREAYEQLWGTEPNQWVKP